MKLLILNGPNLNLLGIREPSVYGHETYDELVGLIGRFAAEHNIAVEVRQSNHEGELIDHIHAARTEMDGIIINPGAFTHYSYAIHDAIKSVGLATVEVHLSNIAAREEFRRTSVTAPACAGQIAGFGFGGYLLAMRWFLERGAR